MYTLSYNTLKGVLKSKHKNNTFNYSFNVWQYSAN